MATFTLGKDCKAYYSATLATSTTPSISSDTEVSNIRDLKIEMTTDKTDITVRSDGIWKKQVTTLIDAKITFSAKWLSTDTTLQALQAAFIGNTEIKFTALTGDKATAGNEGPSGNWNVSNFSMSQGLTEAVMVDVELTPSSFTAWHTTS